MLSKSRNLSKLLVPLSRSAHNASFYPDTLTAVKFPEALRERFVESAIRYANAAHQVSIGKAKWGNGGKDPLLQGIPEEVRMVINETLTTAPQTEEVHNLQKFIDDFKAGKIPVGIITGTPVKPMPLAKTECDSQLVDNIRGNKDFHYNSFIQELMMQAIMGFTPSEQGEKLGVIALQDKPFGSFLSKKGLPWHIDGARNVENPGDIYGIVSLSCINSGDDVTKFSKAKDLFDSLTPKSREELLKPQFEYIEVSEYVNSSKFPIFIKNGDNIGIQLTTGHEVQARSREGQHALNELKGKLEILSKTPGSTAEVTLESGDLAISLNAPYKEKDTKDVVGNTLHLRCPRDPGVDSDKPDRLLTRQFYGFAQQIKQGQEQERGI